MDPQKKSLNFIFPTKYVIPKSLKFSHWPSKYINPYYWVDAFIPYKDGNSWEFDKFRPSQPYEISIFDPGGGVFLLYQSLKQPCNLPRYFMGRSLIPKLSGIGRSICSNDQTFNLMCVYKYIYT